MLLNLHTHHPLPANEQTVPSFGLHPWYLPAPEQLPGELRTLTDTAETVPPPFFIGECGLDRVCATPYDLQLTAFKAQIDLSERLVQPLLLHCVKAVDDVLRLKRGTRQPWVFHGFRGKPEQLRQLIGHGFYISFGLHFHQESVRQCPADRIFLETDDSAQPIAPHYDAIAALRNTTADALKERCWENVHELFSIEQR